MQKVGVWNLLTVWKYKPEFKKKRIINVGRYNEFLRLTNLTVMYFYAHFTIRYCMVFDVLVKSFLICCF